MPDALASYVKFASHFNGANGATTATDEVARHTFTFGQGAQLDTARPVFGSAGLKITANGATGDYVELGGNLADFDFGANDFVVELDYISDGTGGFSTGHLIGWMAGAASTSRSWAITLDSSGRPVANAFISSTAVTRAHQSSIVNDGVTRNTIAIERVADKMWVYLNGVRSTFSGSLFSSIQAINSIAGSGGMLRIGCTNSTVGRTDGALGIIDEVRITVGANRFGGASYTRATAEFDETIPSQPATGFSTTAFGTPSVALTPLGFSSTTFGTPTAQHLGHASGFHATAFGLALAEATYLEDASGFMATVFGQATALQFAPAPAPLPHAASTLGPVTRFGIPSGGYGPSIVDAATIGMLAQFGTPSARQVNRQQASGFAEAVFGTPAAAHQAHASGFRDTQFGAAGSSRIAHATGGAPGTRFGTPGVWYAYRAAGRVHTRFGQPSARSGAAAPAAGFTGTQFGTPSASQIHHARALGSATRFGTPSVQRGSAC